jgi:hypothetical protein
MSTIFGHHTHSGGQILSRPSHGSVQLASNHQSNFTGHCIWSSTQPSELGTISTHLTDKEIDFIVTFLWNIKTESLGLWPLYRLYMQTVYPGIILRKSSWGYTEIQLKMFISVLFIISIIKKVHHSVVYNTNNWQREPNYLPIGDWSNKYRNRGTLALILLSIYLC